MRSLFVIFFLCPTLLLVALIPPSELDTVFGYKPVPRHAVQLGRYSAPVAEAELTPFQELRRDAAHALARWIHGDPRPSGRFQMTYEGTREEAEGLARVPKGEVAPIEPEVWTTVPVVE